MFVRINLLPHDYRKRERLPLKQLLPVMGCLTLVLAAGAFWAHRHFGELRTVVGEKQNLEDQVLAKKPLQKYMAELIAEENEYKDRAASITEIAFSRMGWTRKLDELCSVFTDDDGGERYLVWIQTMEVKPADSRSAGKLKKVEGEAVGIKGLCFSGISDDSNALQRFNQLHEAIKQSDFFRNDFISIANPAGKSEFLEDDLKPHNAWTVDLPMVMAPRLAPGKGAAVAEQGKGKAASPPKGK